MQFQLRQVRITLASAYSTLQICDRQARKDTGKVIRAMYSVYILLDSPEARQHYRMVWNALQVVIAVVWWLCLLVSEYPDRHVQQRPVALLEAAVEAPATEEAPAPMPITDTVVPFKRPAPKCKPLAALTRAELLELAQQRELPGYRKMSTERLRRKLAA